MFDQVMRQARVLEEMVKARLEVDVPGLLAGVRARLESRLALEPMPVPADLAEQRGPVGWGAVRTQAWQSPELRKVVLSYVSLPPIIQGFALVLLPRPRLAAPVFGADLMALPTRVSVNADVYGLPAELPLREVLEPLAESFVRLGARHGPAWATDISSGVGLHAKVSPRVAKDGFAALTAALARYLDALSVAPDGPGGASAQRIFFERFHAHGPRTGPVSRVFGSEWAERYSRLIFE
jgi:hypothetical protein